MPTSQEILAGLASIVQNAGFVAIVWHAIVAAVVIGLVVGWRPSRRFAATALSLPLLSVGILAWIYGNPFNGAVFLLMTLVLGLIGARLPAERIERAAAWQKIIGLLMIAFAWVYPHFVPGGHWLKYLYASPLGLIPCPTLSLVVGFALLAKGFSSRAWSLVVVILGLFYALFGALRLGVRIDFVLLAGVLALFVQVLSPRGGASSSASA